LKLESEARFEEIEDTYVSLGEVFSSSGWAPEFLLAGEWVIVEFTVHGARLWVDDEVLNVAQTGEWHEGKLLGVLVRARLRPSCGAGNGSENHR